MRRADPHGVPRLTRLDDGPFTQEQLGPVVLWFDLRSRKPAPPGELRDAWLTLVRTDDFEAWH